MTNVKVMSLQAMICLKSNSFRSENFPTELMWYTLECKMYAMKYVRMMTVK